MDLERAEKEKIEREKYEGQLKRFKDNAKGLDESLTLFFVQAFNKDSFVTPNFFSLIEKMKILEGDFVRSSLRAIDNTALASIVQSVCQQTSQYIFKDGIISFNQAQEEATAFYDCGRQLSLEELRGMRDLRYLSFINAFDFPYLSTSINRSSFENFISRFLDKLPTHAEKIEASRFNFLKDSSSYIGFTINSWIKILYLTMHIMQNIFGLADEGMKSELSAFGEMKGKIDFIYRFIAARQKYLEASAELSKCMRKKEVSYDAKVVLEEIATDSFKDFLRIDFTRITEGNGQETMDLSPLKLLEFYMGVLSDFVLEAKNQAKIGGKFFQESKKHLPQICVEYCDMGIEVQRAFEHFLDFMIDKEKGYQLMLKSAIQLLKILYPESFPNVPLDPKSLSNTPTPRSQRVTPRDGSPRVVARNSPRETMRSSGGLAPNPDAARVAQIEMWKRRSTGGGSPSPEPDRRSPALGSDK